VSGCARHSARIHSRLEVVAAVGERYLGTRFRDAAEMRAVLDRTLAGYEPILGGP
jgi:hypothetical protein